MRASHLQYHYEAERDHWWFAARREIVLSQLDRAVGARRDLSILDIGCGAGGMLAFLGRYGRAAGVDASPEAVAMAGRDGADVRLGMLPADIPFEPASFDVITLLDVLEHVDADAAALDTIRGLLRPGGHLIVTVPAYAFLWSGHDVVNEHKRRYVRHGLRTKLTAAGLAIERLTYFNTLLFPPIALVRLAGRLRAGDDSADEGRVPTPVNTILRSIFTLEKRLLKAADLPFGVSLLAVARRPEEGRDSHA